MTRDQWEEWNEILEGDETAFMEYMNDMDCSLDVFWLGYEFCVADKLYKED